MSGWRLFTKMPVGGNGVVPRSLQVNPPAKTHEGLDGGGMPHLNKSEALREAALRVPSF